MNLNFRNYVPAFQEGGELEQAPMEQAPMEPQGGDPMQEILAACQQALETQDCNIAMQVCQILMQMAGGGEQPQQAPEDAQPVYRAGGKLAFWAKK